MSLLKCILILLSSTSVAAGGAVYIQTNNPMGNAVVVHSIQSDGTVQFSSVVPTGGNGGSKTAGASDGLFSQDSVVVGGGCLFVVNAGSSTISAFKIQPDQPTSITLLNTVPSGGDFPIAVAYSGPKMLLCALNGGANNGVQCFTATDSGLVALPSSTYQPLGVMETTPPSGPGGSLSDITFNTDGSLLFVSAKGVPGSNRTNNGFIATFTVSGAGATATLSMVAKSSPMGSVLPFSLTLLPGTDTIVYTDPSSGYGVASYTTNGALSASAIYPVPGQGANCWSAYSAVSGDVFLSDPGAKIINEVSVNGTQSTLIRQYTTNGTNDIAVAGQYLYALSPRLTSIEVFLISGPGNVRSIQTYKTSAYTPLTATVQGIAVYLSVVGAVYSSTNSPAGNSVVVHAVYADGTVSFSSLVPTGGNGGAGTPGAVDGLFSQDSVVVGGGCLFVVNAGSNTISAFKIQPDQPTSITLLNTVPSGGDFPIAVAYSGPKMLLCALNGGANNGVQCFTATDSGLVALPSSTYQPLGVMETTPPSGPGGSLSDITFNTDGSLLFVSAKGVPGSNRTNNGFIATFTVSGAGATATLSMVAKSSPMGSVLPFSLTLLPGTDTIVYTDPSSGYGVASYTANGALSASAIYPVPGQGADCWSTYSAATWHVYLSDPGAKMINEVSVNGTQSTLVKQYPTVGTLDIAVGGQYLYALAPRLTGIEVFAVASPGNARSIQTYMTSSYAMISSTMQGVAVFLSPPPPSESCQLPPPAEICCTRMLSNPASTLRITLPAGSALNSLTVWNDSPMGPPLLQSATQLNGLSVSIGSDDTISGCAISAAATPMSTPPPVGAAVYGGWDLVCGSIGTTVILSFPSVQLAPQPPTSVAVKVCARTDGGGNGDASLWIQKA